MIRGLNSSAYKTLIDSARGQVRSYIIGHNNLNVFLPTSLSSPDGKLEEVDYWFQPIYAMMAPSRTMN